MKCIIAGSRTIRDCDTVLNAIADSRFDITEVVSGCADGVDACGEQWAKENGVLIKPFLADWDKFGKAAGPIRNEAMAEYADALILVWDGRSRGSANMLRRAEEYGLKIHEHIVDAQPKGDSNGK